MLKSFHPASALTLALLALAGTALAYPEPNIVSRTWQFDFTHGQPKAIAVRDEQGQTAWYWYITFKVTNNTGSERLFVPSFTVATDDGQIVEANNRVPHYLFEAIRKTENNKLLERPDQVVDKVLQGEDYARESAIIWPAQINKDVVRVNVFVSGLSGETAFAVNPVTQEQVTMRKTLNLEYDMPGRPQSPQSQTVLVRAASWVMR